MIDIFFCTSIHFAIHYINLFFHKFVSIETKTWIPSFPISTYMSILFIEMNNYDIYNLFMLIMTYIKFVKFFHNLYDRNLTYSF